MQNIAKFFIENSKLTVVLTLGMLIYGIMGLKSMNAESYPQVSLATATIVTSYDGATAQDMETKITKLIEDKIREVGGLKDVKSTSQAGLSTIVVRIDMDDPKVDVKEAMSELQRAVDRATGLPMDLRDPPKFTELKSDELPVVELAVVGDNANRKRDIIADLLKEDIEDLRTVKNVRLTGYAERAFHIQLDLEKMNRHHISIEETLNKIKSRNSNTPGGELKNVKTQKLVRIEGKIKNKEEIEQIVIRSNFSGKTLRLKEIATVEDGEEEIKTITRYNGAPVTLITVTKKSGSDTLELVSNVYEKIDSFQKTYPNYKFQIYNNEGIKVKNRIDVLANNAVSGLFLVVFFLFFFLPGRIGVVASLSLPLAVMGTLGMMPNFGMNIDTITVLALVIALGMLVDNSVVISENFTRLRHEGMSSKDAAVLSVKQLWLPITATAFTTIASFMPMLVTKGVMGQFIRFIPIIVTISLLLSLVESFFFLPLRLSWAGEKVRVSEDGENKDWFQKFEKKFESIMSKVLKHQYLTGFFFSLLLVFSFFMMIKANKFILFPAEQTEMYIARVESPQGTTLEQTTKYVEKLSNEIQSKMGDKIKFIVARAGISTKGFGDPKAKEGNNIGMLNIYVTDDTKYNVKHTDFLSEIRSVKIEELSDIAYEALINGPPVGNAIEATFRSNNVDMLDDLLSKIKSELSQVEGVLDLKVNDVYGDEEVYINIDYEKADRLSLDVSTIGRMVRAAVSGNRVSNVTLNNKEIDLILRFKGDYRMTPEDLKDILIMDRMGNLVPIGTFATIEVRPSAPQVKRFDFKRAKTLTGDVNEDKITSFVANKKLTEIFNKYKNDYPGISLVFGGAQESTKESMESLFQALILSLIGIFALLVFLFKSYIRPMIIMTTIPLGLLGFSVAFFFHQRPISFMALIGIIGLGGIIVNSGIVLISFIDQMRDEGNLSLNEILIKASGMRLRAVLVTSLTTISGLIPTAYGIGGSDAMLIPMTLAMAWGLTSGTILTLVWVPCAYSILEDVTSRFGQVKNKVLKSNNQIQEA